MFKVITYDWVTLMTYPILSRTVAAKIVNQLVNDLNWNFDLAEEGEEEREETFGLQEYDIVSAAAGV